MISVLPLERHLGEARQALSHLKAAAAAGATIDAAVEELEARLASLGAAMVERETHLHYQQELNPQLQWIADSNRQMIAVTGQWQRFTGIAPGAALGDGWRALIHPDDFASYQAIADEGLGLGTGYDTMFRVRTADGNYRWLRTRAVPRTGEDGRLLFVYGYTEDVHEQVLAAQALRESEENLRYTIELNPQLPFRAAPDGAVVEVSTKWMKIVGADINALLGLGSIDFVHPDDADRIRDGWVRAIETGEALDSRYRLRTADGSYRWFRSQAGPRFGEDGKIIAWYGVAEDIDRQMRAEEATAEAIEQFRLAARATKDVIYEWDVATGEIRWNEAIELLAGSEPHGLDWWSKRVHPADRDAVMRSLERFVAERGDDWRCDYRFRRADGSWGHIYDRAHMLRGADGSPKRVIGSMADLTERDEAEIKVQELRAELIHVSRLSAMGAMAATLAHELNQPLAAAQNWLSAARAMVAPVPGVPAEALDALGEGRTTILKAGEIIRRIRKLVAGGAVARATEDLNVLIDEALALLKVAEGAAGVVLEVALPPLQVSVDRVQIQQVLLNLMRNALDAMRESSEQRLRVEARSDGATVEIVVTDTGPGLEGEMADALFTPFRTTKPNGLGVGLSICRTIVEAHGGSIWLTSVPGGGTSVHFTVPAAEAEGGTETAGDTEAAHGA